MTDWLRRAVVRHPQLRQPGNYFIVSLACSDVMLSLIYPVYNLAHLELPQIQDVLGQTNTPLLIRVLQFGQKNIRFDSIRQSDKFAACTLIFK